MLVLFLDDNKDRQKKFESLVPSAQVLVHFCSTAEWALMYLRNPTRSWDYVFLDHDLGDEVYADSRGENTGAEVTRWILANKPHIKNVIVHSLNPAGAERMMENLIEAGYVPIYAPFGSALFLRVVKEI